MENLNNVPKTGTFGGSIDKINANFDLVVNAINSLEYQTTKSRGIINYGQNPATVFPNAVGGDWCMILSEGDVFPATIKTYNGSTWSGSGTWNPDGVDLTGYAKTTDMTTAIANLLAQATARMGYGECTVSGTALAVSIPNFILPTSGGTIHIKMSDVGTGASTLNINNTGAKTLWYNGAAVSSNNTWEAGEIISVFYDGTRFMASNSQGGGGKAEKVFYDNSQGGLDSSNVQGAISETNDKTADYLFEDVTEQFSFTNGYGIKTNDGGIRQGGVASYSNYIDLSGYSIIRFTAIRLTSNPASYPFGAAFYNSSKTFLSNTAITYKEYAGSAIGDLYIVEAKIPQGAKYIRITWWASSVSGYSNFKCMAGRDIVGIMKELALMPGLNTIYWNNMGTLYPLPSAPLNTYTYSGGILTINFTNNTTESLTTDSINGITIGQSYKITVKMRKTSDLGGFISIGFHIATTLTEEFRRISPSTIETTYVFIVKAVTNTKLYVGIPQGYNKGETYIISEFKVENANATDGYITDAAKKIIQLESAYNPTITDLQSYITENAGKDIFIPAGTYVCDNLTIPNGTKLHGIAGATTLQLTNGATSIINLTASSSDITIDGIRFVGNNDMSSISSATAMSLANLRARVGEGTECGICGVGHSRKILIQNCEFTRFSLAGIRFYETHTSSLYTWKVKITDCTFTNNWYGYLSDTHSEYHTVMGCSFNYNQVGAFIAGGNNTFSECRFDANGTGFVVSGTAGRNDSHGSAGTCSFNHNKGYGIAIIDINNGYSFTGCHVFNGTGIIISNSIGFNYVGGMVACKIIIDSERNAGYNMFAEDIFTTTYNSGTIEGNPTKLSLHGNRFLTQNNCSSINNNV